MVGAAFFCCCVITKRDVTDGKTGTNKNTKKHGTNRDRIKGRSLIFAVCIFSRFLLLWDSCEQQTGPEPENNPIRIEDDEPTHGDQ